MKKQLKKWLYSLGAIATISTSMATILSCGTKSKTSSDWSKLTQSFLSNIVNKENYKYVSNFDENTGTLTINNSVKEITNVFNHGWPEGSKIIKKIILPNNVTTIDGYAFYSGDGTRNIKATTINIPHSVLKVGFKAFVGINFNTLHFMGDPATSKLKLSDFAFSFTSIDHIVGDTDTLTAKWQTYVFLNWIDKIGNLVLSTSAINIGVILPLVIQINENHKNEIETKKADKLESPSTKLLDIKKNFLNVSSLYKNNNLKYDNYTGIVMHWWGWGLFLSSDWCQKLKTECANAAEMTHTIADACGVAADNPIVGAIVIFCLATSGGGYFIFNDNDGYGIVINNVYASGIIWWHKQEEYKANYNE